MTAGILQGRQTIGQRQRKGQTGFVAGMPIPTLEARPQCHVSCDFHDHFVKDTHKHNGGSEDCVLKVAAFVSEKSGDSVPEKIR